MGVEGFDTSDAAQRSIEVRCKEVAEILNEVKGRRDSWEAESISLIALKKLPEDCYLAQPKRCFSSKQAAFMQKHVIKLAKTDPAILGPSHTCFESGKGTVMGSLVNNQWLAANLLMGNVWKWESGTVEKKKRHGQGWRREPQEQRIRGSQR